MENLFLDTTMERKISGLMVAALIAAQPCTQLARQYHAEAIILRDRAEVEEARCTCACGPCARHVVDLVEAARLYAIMEQRACE